RRAAKPEEAQQAMQRRMMRCDPLLQVLQGIDDASLLGVRYQTQLRGLLPVRILDQQTRLPRVAAPSKRAQIIKSGGGCACVRKYSRAALTCQLRRQAPKIVGDRWAARMARR